MLLSRIWSASPCVRNRCRLESVELGVNNRLIPSLTPSRLSYILSSSFIHVCCLDHFHVGVRNRINTCKAAVALLLLRVIVHTDLYIILSCNSPIKSHSSWANLSAIWSKQVLRHRLSLQYGSLCILLISSCLLPCNSSTSSSLEIWSLDRTWDTSFKWYLVESSIHGIWNCITTAFSKMSESIGCKSILISFQLLLLFDCR